MTTLEVKTLLALRHHYARSRADIARILNISRPTASVVAEALLKKNLIRENGKGKSTGGKSPTIIEPTAKSLYCMGFDFGYRNQLFGVLLDGCGDIVAKDTVEYLPDNFDSAIENIYTLASRLTNRKKVAGAGIGLSGTVFDNNVTRCIHPRLIGTAFAEELEAKLRMPVLLENRPRCAAISEAFGGAADGINDFVLLSLGRSVGSALANNGKVVSGVHGAAGEIRQIRLACGLTFEEALSQNEIAKVGIEETAKRCADGLRCVLMFTDVETVIFTGRFADYGEEFANRVQSLLRCNYPCKVVLSSYGRFSVARGAAYKMQDYQIAQKGIDGDSLF